MPPTADAVEKRRVAALASSQERSIRAPVSYPQNSAKAAEQNFVKTWESKFVVPTNNFLDFGSKRQTGTNPGEISNSSLRRKEMLRKKNGLPLDAHTANVGKEGLENPLGKVGALTSFITDESFIHDPRHGEQIAFPGIGAHALENYAKLALDPSQNVSRGESHRMKTDEWAEGHFILAEPTNIDREEISPHEMARDNSGPISPAREGEIPTWEIAQQERWRERERVKEQIRASAEAPIRKMPLENNIVQNKIEVLPRRGSLRTRSPGSPESRKSISWEDLSPPRRDRIRSEQGSEDDWEQARRARNATLMPSERNKMMLSASRSGESASSQDDDGRTGRMAAPPDLFNLHGGLESHQTGAHPGQTSLHLKDLGRLTAVRQELKKETNYVEGPSTPPGYPPVPSAVKEKGGDLRKDRTLDLKEYISTQIDRSGAPPILNYGARKKSAEGHEASSERPLSREDNHEQRKKFVNPGSHHDAVHRGRPPSNLAYALTSRPPAEPLVRHVDKTTYGYGTTKIVPRSEEELRYGEVVKSKFPKWQNLKPPSMPLYKKPETKSRQREDVWTIVPTVRGDLHIVSNKITRALPGQYEPSLDAPDSQWGDPNRKPRDKPWAYEEKEGGVNLQPRRSLAELDREMALRTFTLSHTPMDSLRPNQESDRQPQKLTLSMKRIRPAGKPAGSATKPRGSTAASLDERMFSQGLSEASRSSRTSPVDFEVNNIEPEKFGVGSILPGRSVFTAHNKTPMPGAPIHPVRNQAVADASRSQAGSRSRMVDEASIPSTLMNKERIPTSIDLTNKMHFRTTINEVLGCHAMYDPKFNVRDARFLSKEDLADPQTRSRASSENSFTAFHGASSQQSTASTISANDSSMMPAPNIALIKRKQEHLQRLSNLSLQVFSRSASAGSNNRDEGDVEESIKECDPLSKAVDRSIKEFKSQLSGDLEELRKIKYELQGQDLSFGWAYRRDFEAPEQARGRFRHSLWVAKDSANGKAPTPYTSGLEPLSSTHLCVQPH